MRTFTYQLFLNLVKSFTLRYLPFHAIAILTTFILVVFGFDWFYFKVTQMPLLQAILLPAVLVGAVLPILLPIVLFALGKIKEQRDITITALALGQAVVLGSLISSVYKSITGRIQPDLANTIIDVSREFQFGFLKHGIFAGWPSSHTTIAFSMAFTLIFLYQTKRSVKYLALFYAFYIGIGISVSVHWFSEFVAGALIGSAIGMVVGGSFLNQKLKSAT